MKLHNQMVLPATQTWHISGIGIVFFIIDESIML